MRSFNVVLLLWTVCPPSEEPYLLSWAQVVWGREDMLVTTEGRATCKHFVLTLGAFGAEWARE